MAGRYPNYNVNPLAPDANGMGSTAQQLAAKIKLGWNMGNSMEAVLKDSSGNYLKLDGVLPENSWGNASVTKELMQRVKQSGFDAIRLPLSWDQYASATTAKIDAEWLGRVKTAVQTAVDAGLYVLINIHWDGGWLENNVNVQSQQAVIDKQRAYWTQIAIALRDFDERLMFASANEPSVENASQMSVLLSYHQTFIDAVRATGGKNSYRVLVVQGPSTSAEKTYQLMNNLPTDPQPKKLMVEVHSYTPYQFTLMSDPQDWGYTAYPFYYWGNGNHSNVDTQHNPTWGEEADVDKELNYMKEKFTSKGIPVVLGEYAAMRRNDQVPASERALHFKSRAYWHKYVTQRALANGIIPFYWDAGDASGKFGSGLFDRDQDTRNAPSNNTLVDTETMNALKSGAGK
jgi:endoglucanase